MKKCENTKNTKEKATFLFKEVEGSLVFCHASCGEPAFFQEFPGLGKEASSFLMICKNCTNFNRTTQGFVADNCSIFFTKEEKVLIEREMRTIKVEGQLIIERETLLRVAPNTRRVVKSQILEVFERVE